MKGMYLDKYTEEERKRYEESGRRMKKWNTNEKKLKNEIILLIS